MIFFMKDNFFAIALVAALGLSGSHGMASYALIMGDIEEAFPSSQAQAMVLEGLYEIAPDDAGVKFSISGGPFAGDSVVHIGGAAVNTTTVGDDLLYFTIPLGTPGTNVTVQVADASDSVYFEGGYTYPTPPTVTHIGEGIPDGEGSRLFLIAGAGFTPETKAYIDDSSIYAHYGDSGRLVAQVSEFLPEGEITIKVRNSYFDDFADNTWTGQYVYQQPEQASFSIDSTSPEHYIKTTGNENMVVYGEGFVAGDTTVTFNDVPATLVNVFSDTMMIVRSAPHAAGPAEMKVTIAGETVVYNALSYAVPVTLTTTDTYGNVGEYVSVYGTGFSTNTRVSFGYGVPDPAIIFISDTQLKYQVPDFSGYSLPSWVHGPFSTHIFNTRHP